MKTHKLSLAGICLLSFVLISCKTEIKRELMGYEFNNEYVEIEAYDNNKFAGNLTIDMYIKLHNYPTAWTSIAHKRLTNEQTDFNLRIKDETEGQWFFGDGTVPIVLRWNPKELLPLNEWTRITAVRNMTTNTLELFINGKSVAKRLFNFTNVAKSGEKIIFLKYEKRTLNATLADVIIWSKALTFEEINSTSGVIPNPTKQNDLLGFWQFNSLKDKEVIDLSGHNPNAVINEL
jgi:hypothetical protein